MSGIRAHVAEPLSRKAIRKGSLPARRRLEKCGDGPNDLPEYLTAAADQLADELKVGIKGGGDGDD